MTLLYHDPVFQQHLTGAHPESPQRLAAIDRDLTRSGLIARCRQRPVCVATTAQLARAHAQDYIAQVERFAHKGGGRIEADTVVSAASYKAAATAAGSACDAVDQVLTGTDRTALCLIRPPGHHALARAAMGFCLFNNVAIAAAHARQTHGLERILIVDWDVHHGNGTQDLFYDRGDVTFFSAHRSPFYPGTGDEDETGTGDGLGATWNLPITYGTPRKEYLARFARMLQDAASRSQPQLVLLSAGFDAHRADPIGCLDLETEDFAVLTDLVLQIARTHCGGKLVSLLEGGYNTTALAECVAVHLDGLIGAGLPGAESAGTESPGVE